MMAQIQENAMDYEAEIAAIEAEQEALNQKENALRERKQAAYNAQRAALEAAAGDVKAGDLVMVKEKYGSAQPETLYLVESVGMSEDRGGNPYKTVTIHYMGGGTSVVDILNVVRVPADNAAALWKQI